MDWFDQHPVILDCYNKEFTLLDEQRKLKIVHGSPKAVTVWEFTSLQLNKSFSKVCRIFTTDMEETPKDKVPNIEDYVSTQERY
jgi:hypothetical protein